MNSTFSLLAAVIYAQLLGVTCISASVFVMRKQMFVLYFAAV